MNYFVGFPGQPRGGKSPGNEVRPFYLCESIYKARHKRFTDENFAG